MLNWHDRARLVIDDVHRTLPADISFKARKKAIADAYPFGEQAHHPYKAWCRAQRAYLSRYSDEPAGPLDARPTKNGE